MDPRVRKLILGDIYVVLCIILTFMSNLTNIFHDSGVVKIAANNRFLTIYKHTVHVLWSSVLVSFILFLIRYPFVMAENFFILNKL